MPKARTISKLSRGAATQGVAKLEWRRLEALLIESNWSGLRTWLEQATSLSVINQLSHSDVQLLHVLVDHWPDEPKLGVQAISQTLRGAIEDPARIAQHLLDRASAYPKGGVKTGIALSCAMDLAPAHPDVLHAAAWWFDQCGQTARASSLIGLACTARSHDAQLWASAAWFALNLSNLEEAELAIQCAMQHDARSARVWWLRGLVYKKRGRVTQAQEALIKALQIDPQETAAAQTLGWLMVECERWNEAALWADRALALGVNSTRLELSGRIALHQGRFVQANRDFEQALALDPNRASLIAAQATAQLGLGAMTRAWQQLDHGLALLPGNIDITIALANWHQHQGSWGLARDTLETLVKDAPDHVAVWRALLKTQLRLQAWPQAGHCCHELVRLAPHDAATWRDWAQVEIARRNLPNALQKIDQCLGLNANDGIAQRLRARILMDQGELDAARHQILAGLRKRRTNTALWIELGYVNLQRQRVFAAWRAAQVAFRQQADSLEVWRLRLWCANAIGSAALACEMAERLLQHPDRCPEDDIAATHAFIGQNLLDRAMVCAQRAVLRYPELSDSHAALAATYRRCGQPALERLSLMAAAACVDVKGHVGARLCELAWTHHGVPALDITSTEQTSSTPLPAPSTRAMWTAHASGVVSAALKNWLTGTHRASLSAEQLVECVGVATDLEPVLVDASVVALESALRAEPGSIEIMAQLWRWHSANVLAGRRLLANQPAHLRLQGLAKVLIDPDHWQTPAQHQALISTALHQSESDLGLAWAALVQAYRAGLLTPEDALTRARQWGLSLGIERPVLPPAQSRSTPRRWAWLLPPDHAQAWIDVISLLSTDLCCHLAYVSLEEIAHLKTPPHIAALPLDVSGLTHSLRAHLVDVVVDLAGSQALGTRFVLLQQLVQRPCAVAVVWGDELLAATGIYDTLWINQAQITGQLSENLGVNLAALPNDAWPLPWPNIVSCWQPQADCLPNHQATPLDSSSQSFLWGWVLPDPACLPSDWRLILGLLAQAPTSRVCVLTQSGVSWGVREWLQSLADTMGIGADRWIIRVLGAAQSWGEAISTLKCLLLPSGNTPPAALRAGAAQGCPVLTGPIAAYHHDTKLFVSALGQTDQQASSAQEWTEMCLRWYQSRSHAAAWRTQQCQALAVQACLQPERLQTTLSPLIQAVNDSAISRVPALNPRQALVARLTHRWHCIAPDRLGFNFSQHSAKRVDVSVVMVLFNQIALTRAAVQALADQRGVCFELIVVDNASSDGTADWLQNLKGATILPQSSNLGFLMASNLGAARARGRHILMLNNDAIVHQNALLQAVQTLDQQPQVGAVGARIVLPNGTLQEAGCVCLCDGSTRGLGRGQTPTLPEFAFEREVDFCSGVFLMFRRQAWEQLGGFDTRYAPAYYEDTDFCLRLWARGWSVLYQPRIWVTHLEGASASADSVKAWINKRQRIFARRHAKVLAQRPSAISLRYWRDRFRAAKTPRVLVIDNEVPHSHLGGGLPRAKSVLAAMSPFHLCFYPVWTLHDTWNQVYETVSARTEVILGRGAQGLAEFLRQRQGSFDLIWVSRSPNMKVLVDILNRQPELLGGAQVVYDAEAVFAQRDVLQAQIQGHPMSRLAAARHIGQEIALAQGVRAVVAVSASEAALFRTHGHTDVRLLTHSMTVRSRVPGFHRRGGLLFIGAIHPNTPNEDSLLWFLNEIFPLLKNYMRDPPELTVIGACHSPRLLQMQQAGWRWMGIQDDLTPWYDSARIFVAPTRFAAGVPAKVIEAACQGIPVVATGLLAAQLGWQDNDALAWADDAVAFACKLAQLYQSPKHWATQQRLARQSVGQLADPSTFSSGVQQLVLDVVDVRED